MIFNPNSGSGTAPTYDSLQGRDKKQQTGTQKKRMFAKIRKAIKGNE